MAKNKKGNHCYGIIIIQTGKERLGSYIFVIMGQLLGMAFFFFFFFFFFGV